MKVALGPINIHRRMDKEDVVHIYMEYYSGIKRNEIGSFVKMCMNLEIVIQSEVGQKEKKKIYIKAYIWNLEK